MSVVPNFNLYKCDKCDSNGFIVGENSAVKCECRKQYEYELSASNVLLQSGLLTENSTYEDFKKLINYSFDDYKGKDENGNIKRIKKYVDEFERSDKPFKNMHFYIWGGQGTQKSYTLKGMLAKLACKGKSVYYTFLKNLISLIIESDRDENAKSKLNYIMNVDVLVIDEFEEKRANLWASGYKENTLITWLKDRLEVIRKSTFFISNDSIETMKQSKFGELYGDLLDRETKFGRFEFTDRYMDSLSKEEIQATFASIWDD